MVALDEENVRILHIYQGFGGDNSGISQIGKPFPSLFEDIARAPRGIVGSPDRRYVPPLDGKGTVRGKNLVLEGTPAV